MKAEVIQGDCLKIIPSIPDGSIDLCIADPPYGINYVNGAKYIPNATKFSGEAVVGDDKPFDPMPLLRFPNLILWGANHYADKLPVNEGRWLIWDKRCQVVPQRDTSDCEMAWVRGSGGKAARIFYHLWDGFLRASEKGVPRLHPMQKPVELMRWCLSFFPEAKTILDPYCGSGSTGVACVIESRSYVGIEIDPHYAEVARARITRAQGRWAEIPKRVRNDKPTPLFDVA